jgi:hypothetical protein
MTDHPKTKRITTTQEPVTLDPEPESFGPKPPKRPKPRLAAALQDLVRASTGAPVEGTTFIPAAFEDYPEDDSLQALDALLDVLRSRPVETFVAVTKPSEAAEILAWADHFRPLRELGQ